MKTIRFELTPEQNDQMKGIQEIVEWEYSPSNGVFALTIKEHPHCLTCGQKLALKSGGRE